MKHGMPSQANRGPKKPGQGQWPRKMKSPSQRCACLTGACTWSHEDDLGAPSLAYSGRMLSGSQ